MVMQDGFITSHSVENVEIFSDSKVKKFIGQYNPKNPLLNIDKPVTYGPLQLTDYYFETKYQEAEGFEGIISEYTKIGKELSEITGSKYPVFEGYKIKDAEVILIVLSSSAGTVKEVVEKYRKEGKKVGVLKPKLFRPFPYKEVYKAISHAKVVGVLDRSMARGAFPPLASDIKISINTYKEGKNIPDVVSHIFGLGGRDLLKKDIEIIFDNLLNNKYNITKIDYIGVRK
jgi:pyruvate ferredoxin oxidoreductase alpha subunit